MLRAQRPVVTVYPRFTPHALPRLRVVQDGAVVERAHRKDVRGFTVPSFNACV